MGMRDSQNASCDPSKYKAGQQTVLYTLPDELLVQCIEPKDNADYRSRRLTSRRICANLPGCPPYPTAEGLPEVVSAATKREEVVGSHYKSSQSS
jgi:hypothetical protein